MKKLLMFGLVFFLATSMVSAYLGGIIAPAQGVVYNGSGKDVLFNCTAWVNEGVLGNITIWHDFDGGELAYAGINATAENNTINTWEIALPTTQGTYNWGCIVVVDDEFQEIDVNTLLIDTTPPTISLAYGTSTVKNGSVLIAHTLGGLYFTTSDTGGGTVNEAVSYANDLKFTNGTTNFDGSWSSPSEGVFRYDLTDLTASATQSSVEMCVYLNLTDSVGNVKEKTKYCIIWDQNKSYSSAFTLKGVINATNTGVLTPLTLSIENNFGKATWANVDFTGYHTNFNLCQFTQDSIMCPSTMGLTSKAATLVFRNTTSFTTEPRLYKDGAQYPGTSISWDGNARTYSVNVVGFSTYYLVDSIIGGSGGGSYAVCGDGICQSPIETPENCPIDCGQSAIPPVTGSSDENGFVPITPPSFTPPEVEGISKTAILWGVGLVIAFSLFLMLLLSPTKKGRRIKRSRRRRR